MRIPQRAGLRGRLIAGWVGGAAVFWVAGCGGNGAREPVAASFIARRVVCATPAVAEIVFALGCGDRVVGVSGFTDWPPEASSKPQIGGALSPNRESILRLEPDLILSQGKSEVLGGFAQAQGIEFLSLPLDALPDLRAAIAGFARVLGVAEDGARLLDRIDADFAAIPSGESVPVFLALGHAPGDLSGLMTSGPNTFLSQLVGRVAGSNVFADVDVLWPKISQETLVRRRPAIILDFQSAPADAARRAALVADWRRLGFQAEQVRILDDDCLLKPGPRVAQSAARIAAAIRGE